MKKENIIHSEKFKSGTILDKYDLLDILNKNINSIVIEIRERNAYPNKVEEIVVAIRL